MFKTNKILGILIFVFLALGMVGCSDRGGTTKSGSGTTAATSTESGQVDLPTKSVTIDAPALKDAGISLEQYSIVTFLSEVALSDTQQTSATFADAAHGQILFVNDNNGNPIAVAYVSADEIAAGSFTMTIDSIADGFIMSNPLMMGYSAADRLSILAQAKLDSVYSDLKNEISKALSEEPENMLNKDVYPKIYEYAITLIINSTNAIASKQAPAFAKGIAKASPAVVVGDDETPYLSDVSGDNIKFVNPTMVFYGIDISGKSPQLIAGKDTLWSVDWAWPPAGWTDPVSEEYSLGSGSYDFRFTKGKLSGTDADLMATAANALKASCLLLDIVFWCPVENETIGNIVETSLETDLLDAWLTGLGDYGTDLTDPQAWAESMVDYMSGNWKSISKAFYKNAEDKEVAVQFLKNTKKILGAAESVFKVLDAYDASTTTVPFFWDAVFKPGEINLCATQTNGTLSATCQQIPPTAMVTKVSPDEPYVGDSVIFDASSSYDDSDPVSSLMVRWDFDGDGTFDTDWSTEKTASYTYSNVGSYNVYIEVKDSSALFGSSMYTVYIQANQAQGTANHIKVFRDGLPWDSSAFETVMSDYGYTEGDGENQYEILASDLMATEIMIPGQDLIIIMNDQDQTFYNNLAASYSRFERFLENGGVILWEASDMGWADGSMATAGLTLPSGVTYEYNYDETNYVVNPDSELMSGLPTTLTGTYASHEHFLNLPEDAVIYTTDTQNLPTLVEYKYQSGWVILTGQPLEWGYDRLDEYTIGQVYPRLFDYVLGKVQQASPNISRSKSLVPKDRHDIPSHVEK